VALQEARRGYPSYRSPSDIEPNRAGLKTATSRDFRISYDDLGQVRPPWC
jgi:Zn-finger domain-containing protein